MAGMSFVPMEASAQEDASAYWQRENAAYVSGTNSLMEWTARELESPLGKRELTVLRQIYEHRGKNEYDGNFIGAGPWTVSKVGARGFLVNDGDWYKLQLTPAGVAAFLEATSAA